MLCENLAPMDALEEGDDDLHDQCLPNGQFCDVGIEIPGYMDQVFASEKTKTNLEMESVSGFYTA